MDENQAKEDDVVAVVEDGLADGPEAVPARRRLRLKRTWAELRPSAPWLVFACWAAAVLVVALARVDPWNEWRSWRKWLRADERGWELLIPGLVGMLATWILIRSHDRWGDEGWSPEVVAMVAIAVASGAGAILWGLYALGLRPFA